jgi:BirA family biotin operon repressor/biotin-[acetyl-CoA-carboxylase] ligase
MDKESLQRSLASLPISKLHFFEETDSTNEQALRMGANGGEDNTLFIAEKQTAGRGRMGRRWETAAGSSLAFTLGFLPTKAEQEHLSLFSLLGALAVCRAIKKHCGVNAQVKWPNDVLLDGRKTAGILAECNWKGDCLAGVVLGIGINLLPGSVPPAEGLLFPATCVQEHCSKPIVREEFLRAMLKEVFNLRRSISRLSFMREYAKHLAFMGKRIILSETGGDSVSGILTGVERDGQVILRMEDGQTRVFPIGDVHLRPGNS